MATNNPLETILKKQQAFVENWADTSKKILESNYETLTSPFKQGTELFNENLKAQKALVEESIQSQDIFSAIRKSPEYFQKWLTVQSEYTQKWLDLFQESSTQQMNLGKENAQKFSDNFKETYTEWEKFLKESSAKFNDDVKTNLEKSSKDFPFLASFIKGYETLNNFWKPILEKGVIKGNITRENFNKFFPEESFTKIVDTFIGLNSTENFKKTTETFTKFFDTYAEKLHELQENSKKSTESLFGQVEKMYVGTPAEPIYNLYKDFVESLGDVKPVIGNFDSQKQTKQLTENYLKGRKLFIEYLEISLNFQQKVYDKAKDSMTETIDKYWEINQKNGKTPSYDEFLAAWLKITQANVSEILHSEELNVLKKEITTSREKVVKVADELIADYAKFFQTEQKKSQNDELPKLNDLKIVEGIGPKIEELLKKSGISTWETLANTSVESLKEILNSAGKLFNRHDPSSWAMQAKLAFEGNFEELKKLQSELYKGLIK